MSSLRNAVSRRAHKERAQPHDRSKFGLLEKHKDYVIRAKAYQNKQETLRILKEKAASRNPNEFYFKMINTRVVDGVHRPESRANKYSAEELMIMKTQDIGYVFQKLQSEKKKIERLNSTLHLMDSQTPNRHVYFAENSEEVKEIQAKSSQTEKLHFFKNVPSRIKRQTIAAYNELEGRKARVQQLEKIHSEMTMQKELQKKGRKRKLREDEIVCPTDKPVYKWRPERKR